MENATDQIHAIVLAAGEASRMGQAKQLMVYDGKTLLHHIVDEIRGAGLTSLRIVTGAYQEQVEAEARRLSAITVHNPDWQTGMGSSVVCGLRTLLEAEPDAKAVLFFLVDQPLIVAQDIESFIIYWRSKNSLLQISDYGREREGVPVLFTYPLFPELLHLKGDQGARPLLKKYGRVATTFFWPAAGLDVDTPEDFDEL